MGDPQAPLAVAVLGTGALGRHHTRLLAGLDSVDLIGIYDQRAEVATAVAEEFGTKAWAEPAGLLERVQAVVLAVPTSEHARIGCDLLSRGLHVLVEKPIAASLEEAQELIDAAGDRVLAVGHVEFHNPAVQALLRSLEAPRFIEVERLAAFTPRSLDIDVVLDLMIHDLQVLHALDPSAVSEIRATGIAALTDRVDMANVRIELESGCVANLAASRVSMDKVRKFRVFQSSRYYSLDYQAQEIRGFELIDGDAGRTIQPIAIDVERKEPLLSELRAFVGACRGEETAYVDGKQGLRALSTAQAILQNIH